MALPNPSRPIASPSLATRHSEKTGKPYLIRQAMEYRKITTTEISMQMPDELIARAVGAAGLLSQACAPALADLPDARARLTRLRSGS